MEARHEGMGLVLAPPAVTGDCLAFQILVGEEEVFHFEQEVRGQVGPGGHVGIGGVIRGHGEDLGIGTIVIRHAQQADGPRTNHHAGVGRTVDEHEDIRRITILGQGAWDEADTRPGSGRARTARGPRAPGPCDGRSRT